MLYTRVPPSPLLPEKSNPFPASIVSTTLYAHPFFYPPVVTVLTGTGESYTHKCTTHNRKVKLARRKRETFLFKRNFSKRYFSLSFARTMGTGRTFRETFEYREYKWFPLDFGWNLDCHDIIALYHDRKKLRRSEKDNCKKKETTRNKMEG